MEDFWKIIENGLAHWHDPDSEFRKRFEKYREEAYERFRPLQEALTRSEMLTERDYMIRINVRDYW